MNEEEALEIFKNLILLPYDWKITNKYKGTINFIGSTEGNEAIQIISNLVEKLQKENEELKNDYENLSNSVVVKNHYIKNSIPVQKVKDKIEEYKKDGIIKNQTMPDVGEYIKHFEIKALQELLEGREKWLR